MIIVKNYTDVESNLVEMDGAVNTRKRLLVGKPDGAPLFSVRMFEVDEGGNTPYHNHDFEHEIYVLDGKGSLVYENGSIDLKPGSVVYVPPRDMHQFVNAGTGIFRFLCMVPRDYE